MTIQYSDNPKAMGWYHEAKQLRALKKHHESIRAYSNAIARDSCFARAYFERGVCHYNLGHRRMAAEDINSAASLGCEDALPWSRFSSEE